MAETSELVASVLEAEAERSTHVAADPVVLPDDLLPGVGSEPMSTRDALRAGGWPMLGLLTAVSIVDEIERAAVTVLAPDIQRSLGVSDAVLSAAAASFGVLFVLGAIPIASLADRVSRTRLAAVMLAMWSGFVLLTGLVTNAFGFFVARIGGGLGQSSVLPVHHPLLADTYPLAARGRIFASQAMGTQVGTLVAPLLVGSLAAAAGGDEGWRWVFVAIALPSVLLAIGVGSRPDPGRGRWEQRAVLGDELDEDAGRLPVSFDMAFARLRQIKTFSTIVVGIGVLGFALVSIPLFVSLHLRDEFDLDVFDRGVFASLMVLPSLVALPFVGRRVDTLMRRSPARTLVLVGLLVTPLGPLVAAGLHMPTLLSMGVLVALGTTLPRAAFVAATPIIAAVAPYRLRSQAFAMVGLYLFFLGSFFGAVVTGMLSDTVGIPLAVAIVSVPSSLIGGALIAYGARSVNADISMVVEDLQEEQAERERLVDGGVTPALQVRNLDFSYGHVQVLFDVDLDVQQGETLALLGTNGAGKSTLLRVISGLAPPHRGIVRFQGRDISYVEAERRVGVGIVQLAGGRAVFADLTVAENLQIGTHTIRRDAARVAVATEEVLELFPDLATRTGELAGNLSGGQQQMLALAKVLVLDPDILIIDELSLGLAPVVVQRLLDVIGHLRERGMTMIIVEQSLNVACAVAGRAVFMEKGAVRFDGPTSELLDRGDLARAVFLGAPDGARS